jgi:hypothetical protein
MNKLDVVAFLNYVAENESDWTEDDPRIRGRIALRDAMQEIASLQADVTLQQKTIEAKETEITRCKAKKGVAK